ncbi:plasmid replication protein RepC [Methylobacterium radiotolerans]|uniref:plasmid replication protein RepC n=1 Tax=Methylobacterium radiotolerans TaxID=31998 RepID=UPI0009771226|nr:plasmid replication protein RepC [Methylobacterium radiotolerans]ONF49426.1 hypothetical protein RSM1_09115 [Methylobacterium radiotolerans]
MLQVSPALTGRRKITPAMLSARAARPSSYEPTKRGTVLAALKRAAEPIGCPFKLVVLIDYLVGCTHASDWTHGGRIWAWPSNAVLSDALGVGPSQLKALFRVGQELGLFEIHDSPTGKRYGRRDAEGRVSHAFGFDLSPLACRRAEFERIAAERRASWKLGEQLRADVTALRNKVLALTDLGQEQGAAGDWQGIAAMAKRLAASRGRSRDPSVLTAILGELAELHQGAIDALTPAEPVDSDPMGSENRPLLTPTTHLTIAKANTRADGPSRPGVNALTCDRSHVAITTNEARPQPVESGKREGRQEGALRGFVASPDFVVQIAPSFGTWTGKQSPTWHDLLDASTMVRHELGISQHAWGQACTVMGRMEAVVLLAAIAARHEAGEVGSPGGMLRKMVELHQSGTLRLDRTLFGLADRLKSRAH